MAAGQATPRWSDTEAQDGVSATQSWDVPADSPEDAIAAVPVQLGATYDKDSSLTAEAPTARTNEGPKNFVVTVRFSPADENTDQKQDKRVPQIQWSRSASREPIDRDANGVAILNAAGDPFDPPADKDVGDRGFSIYRFERGYDLSLAETYEDTCNDADVVLLGKYKFAKGQLRLMSYLPTGRYNVNVADIECEYRFEFRRDGWNHRILNQGRNGWGQDRTGKTVRGPIVFKNSGEPVTSDVLIDKSGLPIDAVSYAIMVGREKATPNANPAPLAGELFESAKDSKAVFLRYPRYPLRPFKGLQL